MRALGDETDSGIRGGQGRSGTEVEEAAIWGGWALALIALLVILAAVLGG